MTTPSSVDFSMYALYQQELENHIKKIQSYLDELASSHTPPDLFTKLQDAFHQINGVAKLVKIETVERVSKQIVEFFKAAKDTPPQDIEASLKAVQSAIALIIDSTQAKNKEDLEQWLITSNKKSVKVSALLSAIHLTHKSTPLTSNKKVVKKTKAKKDAGLADSSMLNLFLSEADTQLEILSTSFVESENELGNPHVLELLMRAAHSLKGAARIVGFDGIVGLSHAMEDIFVAAQKDTLKIQAEHVDLLLNTIDLLRKYAHQMQASMAKWKDEDRNHYEAILAALVAIKDGTYQTPSKIQRSNAQSPAASESNIAIQSDAPKQASATKATRILNRREDVVRISIDSMNRLMGLTAESLVETRRLDPFRDTLLKIKDIQAEFTQRLDRVRHFERDRIPKQDQQLEIETLYQLAYDNLEKTRVQIDKFDNFSSNYTVLSDRLYREVLQSRMRPFTDGVISFPRLVRDLSRSLGKKVKFQILGKHTPVDREILSKLDASLTHILRNACDHGIETPQERRLANKPEVGNISLAASHLSGMLVVEIKDDGDGIDVDKIRQKIIDKQLLTKDVAKNLNDEEILQFLFLPGFSTHKEVTEISGRGVGLDVVHTLMQDVGGQAKIITKQGEGSTFRLKVPVTRSVIRALIVNINEEPYAFPLNHIVNVKQIKFNELEMVENRQYLNYDNQNISLVSSRTALGFGGYASSISNKLTIVIIQSGIHYYAIEVDELVGESNLVVRTLDTRWGKVPGISAAAITEDGSPLLILDIDDLVQSIDKLQTERFNRPDDDSSTKTTENQRRILIVDDSLTVRETERKLLEKAGYHVELAVDGVDGWNAVRLGQFDLMVTDIDMPRLNGFELIEKIRAHPSLLALPIIIISYKDREEDRNKGLKAGANHYLTKNSFQDQSFIKVIEELVGKNE